MAFRCTNKIQRQQQVGHMVISHRFEQMLNEKEGDTSVWDAVRLTVLATLHQSLCSVVQFVLACANTVIASCFGCGPKPLPLAGLQQILGLGPNKFWSCVFAI